MSGSLLQIYPFNTKPSAPPVGSYLFYMKTDNVLYLQDSTGVEYPFAATAAITQLVGDGAASGPGVATLTLSSTAVTGKILTGFVSGPNSVVLATDSILQGLEKLQAQVSASSGSAITALTGDVSAVGPGSVAATVNFVGGSSAANIHSAELAANAATALNTASTIVKRDASGNFAANVITASLSGNATTATTATNFSGSLSGDVTGTQSATVVAFVDAFSAAAVGQSVTDTQAATSVNTASTIVKRDASGNFSAANITANLIGNVSGTAANVTGIVAIANGGTNSSAALTNNKIIISVGGAIVEASAITAHRALISNANGIPIASVTTDTEISYVSGVTSSIQAQLNAITGSAITSLTGDGTATGPGAAVFTLSNSAVTGQLLTGYVVGSNTPISATDSILTAFEKVQGQLNSTAGSAITALTGDVSATGPGSVAATVNSVGGSSAVNIHSAELAANAATSANTASTIVKRDASGNFAASLASLSKLNVTGVADSVEVTIKGNSTQTSDIFDILNSSNVKLFSVNNAGNGVFLGTIAASNFSGSSSGTNTGDVTITNTNSITLSLTGQNLSANLNLSGDAADAGFVLANTSIHGGGSPGLLVEVAFGTPVQIGTSNAIGAASSFSLSDHVHAHGNQTVGTLHAAATTSVNGFMSSTDKAKLDAIISTGATNTQILISDGTNFNARTVSQDATITNTGAVTVTGIQTHPVSSSAPTDAQFLVYNSTSVQYAPVSLSGDLLITHSGVATIQPNVVSNSKLAQMPANTIKGNNTGVTANALDLTTSQVNSLLGTVTTIGTYDSQTSQANGLDIVGNTLYAQSATTSNPGMVNTTTQSFAGNKTFTGTVAISPSSTTALVINSTSFVFDSTNNAMGIGIQPATNTFIDAVNSTAASKTLQLTGYGVGSTVGTRGRFARGTSGTPAAAQSGDIINFWSARGYGTSQFAAASTAAINAIAGETFTNTSNATYLAFNTTPTGSVTSSEKMRINSTGNILVGTTTDNATDLLQLNAGAIATYVKLAGATSGNLKHTVPATVTSYTLVWPSAQGAAGTYLSDDGSGNLSWTNPLVNIDGGAPDSNYVASQVINGGTP